MRLGAEGWVAAAVCSCCLLAACFWRVQSACLARPCASIPCGIAAAWLCAAPCTTWGCAALAFQHCSLLLPRLHHTFPMLPLLNCPAHCRCLPGAAPQPRPCGSPTAKPHGARSAAPTARAPLLDATDCCSSKAVLVSTMVMLMYLHPQQLRALAIAVTNEGLTE